MVGTITNSKLLGGWNLKLQSANKLPQDLASAVSKLFGSPRFGGKYTPLFYVGSQPVNGVNHKIIFEIEKQISGGKIVKDFAIITINIPVGDLEGKNATIIAEEDVTDFILRDELETGFKKALLTYTGANLKPILEIGEQIVKGKNYFFICETSLDRPDEDAYLTIVGINNFQNDWKIIEVERI